MGNKRPLCPPPPSLGDDDEAIPRRKTTAQRRRERQRERQEETTKRRKKFGITATLSDDDELGSGSGRTRPRLNVDESIASDTPSTTTDVTVLERRFFRLVLLRDFSQALEDVHQLKSLQPSRALWPAWEATVHGHLGNEVEELACLNESLSVDPEDADTFFERGNAHLRLNQYSSALGDYDKALTLKPSHYQAMFAKACLLEIEAGTAEGMPESCYVEAAQLRDKSTGTADVVASLRAENQWNEVVKRQNQAKQEALLDELDAAKERIARLEAQVKDYEEVQAQAERVLEEQTVEREAAAKSQTMNGFEAGDRASRMWGALASLRGLSVSVLHPTSISSDELLAFTDISKEEVVLLDEEEAEESE